MDIIADSLSTKTCFVIFCIIAFLPLFFQMPHDILAWQAYLSQTVIQLVALSVLAIVAKKESREQSRILREELGDLREIMRALHIKIDGGYKNEVR
jgi:hypothetical protein